MSNSDPLQLAGERDQTATPTNPKTWVVLVVDDEEEIHAVTAIALHGFNFAGRELELISAFSGEEAKAVMRERNDVAMILLDVVMETDTAGLEVVQYIREQLGNRFTRIVLRTGQPGQAPEFDVITNYDINDYKEKTELTRQKLFTCVYTSLSSYRDLTALEMQRHGLMKVIDATASLFECHSMDEFTQGVIEQLSALLYLDQDVIVVRTSAIALEHSQGRLEVVAAIGKYKNLSGCQDLEQLDEISRDRINNALQTRSNQYGDDYYTAFYLTNSGVSHILYIAGNTAISTPDISLVELFTKNVGLAHENLATLQHHTQ